METLPPYSSFTLALSHLFSLSLGDDDDDRLTNMNVAPMYPQRHFLPQPHFYQAPAPAAGYPYWASHTTSYGSYLAGPSTFSLPVQHPFTFTMPYPSTQVRRPTWAPEPQHNLTLGTYSAPQAQFQQKATTRPRLSPLLLAELPECQYLSSSEILKRGVCSHPCFSRIPAVPPSPTDTCSSRSSALTPPLSSMAFHVEPRVVCAVPLVAPRPLPYHSPRFLQFDDLPDMSEDLSHPPYAQRQKRKRVDDDEFDFDMTMDGTALDSAPPAKRTALAPVSWNGSRHRRLAPPPRVPSASQWMNGGIRYPQVARG